MTLFFYLENQNANYAYAIVIVVLIRVMFADDQTDLLEAFSTFMHTRS